MSKTSKTTLSKLSTFLDPFLVVGILVLFTIPIITLLNLTPAHRPAPAKENVLGIANQSKLTITPNTIALDGISVEKFTQTTDRSYELQVSLLPHEAGSFQNTLLTAINGTDEEKTINITSEFESFAQGSKVSIVVDDVRFVVLAPDGAMYPPTLYVMPGDSLIASILVESPDQVNFATGFSLDLSIE
jgi:hypothetical protein